MRFPGLIAACGLLAANALIVSPVHAQDYPTKSIRLLVPFATGGALSGFDAVVFHQVLHYLDDPGAAVAEAVRVMRAGGRLLIADFASHDLEFLRTDFAHRRLFIAGPLFPVVDRDEIAPRARVFARPLAPQEQRRGDDQQ